VIGRPQPKPLPDDRPIIGGKPGTGDRPGIGDRPVIGRPQPKPLPDDRPIIGGKPDFGDRPSIGHRPGGGNVGNWIGNDFNFNFNTVLRPNWGYGRPHWGHHWYNHHINHHHHGWYHGCWSGHWGSHWYVPAVVGATYWGLSALTSSWGYGYHYGYVNPYYTAPVVATVSAHDYSQPIVIKSYAEPGDENAATDAGPPAVTDSSDEQAGYRLFDQAREAFKRSDYRTALKFAQQALQKVRNDPVVHEFNALCLFANRQYQPSAAVLNALLAVAPGMDWTTLTGLYGNVDEYTGQLRALETHCKQKPEDSAAAFVLAYHYLICGHADSAKSMLRRVVETQTNDQVAKRMYEAIKGEDEIAAAPPSTSDQTVAKPEVQPTPETVQPDEPPLTTDLVGQWRAERDGNTFDLSIDEQGQFAWKATPKGKEPTTITGDYRTTEDTLLMDSTDQGTMAGRVTSGGPDQFQFVVAGGPPGDTGLEFHRVKAQP